MKNFKKFTSLLVITVMTIINPFFSHLYISDAYSNYKDISVMIVTSDNLGSMTIGSGFPYTSDGKIITNYHVIEKAVYGSVIFEASHDLYPFSIIGVDKINDIAILKIEKETTPLRLGNLSKVIPGDSVKAIGNPLGAVNVASEGIITKLSNDSIYFTAPINQGNSGGPLLNSKGEVIGIVTAIVSWGSKTSSFATPASLIDKIPLNLDIPILPFSNLLQEVQVYEDNHNHLEMVLNGTLNSIPSATVEDSFNAFFANPEFSHFISTDRASVVEFKGICLYNNEPANVLIQFVVENDDVFYIHYMEVNGSQKDNIEILGLLKAINQHYIYLTGSLDNAS